jgi:acyl-CoA dehydrogenase family protein 9
MHNGMGFLENLYEGKFVSELFDLNMHSADEEKVQKFMKGYWKAIEGYNPLELEKLGQAPPELMDALKKTGIFGLTIPTEYGGLGFKMSEYLRVVEEMARHDMALVLIPLAHLSIGIKGIYLSGSDEQKKNYLTKAASGEMVFAYALTEPKTGSDARHVETMAKLSDDGKYYILNGSKTYITNGNYAGGLTVYAQMDEEKPGFMGGFIVETAWDGVKIGKDMPKMGLKISSTTSISFKDVKVPVENLIGKPGEGFKIAMNVLNYGRLGLGAASAGLMQQSLEDMKDRALKRKQFGVSIRDFELIQEKMVKARAHRLASRAITYYTAAMLDMDRALNVALESSHTKLYGTNECWNTLYDALQTAGGAGFISTQPYEKRMRDFRVTTIFEGTTEIHTIYPPLTLFRSFGKELKKQGTMGKLGILKSIKNTKAFKAPKSDYSEINAAYKMAGSLEKAFRKLLAEGFSKYGSKIVSQEFYLRRMTRLSVSLYILISVSLYLKAGELENGDFTVLEYLIAEADQTLREVMSDQSMEAAHKAVYEKLYS